MSPAKRRINGGIFTAITVCGLLVDSSGGRSPSRQSASSPSTCKHQVHRTWQRLQAVGHGPYERPGLLTLDTQPGESSVQIASTVITTLGVCITCRRSTLYQERTRSAQPKKEHRSGRTAELVDKRENSIWTGSDSVASCGVLVGALRPTQRVAGG